MIQEVELIFIKASFSFENIYLYERHFLNTEILNEDKNKKLKEKLFKATHKHFFKYSLYGMYKKIST